MKINDIKTIWFDAWKYENEKEFALIPLLKTIAFSLKEDKKYDNLKDTLREAAIFTLGVSEDIIPSMVTTYAGKEIGGLIKKSIGNATTKLIPQLKDLKKLCEIDENSIFYNGIDNIQNEIDKLRDKNKDGNSKLRFVIFVDDLDRCFPEKVLKY